MTNRRASLHRATAETDVQCALCLDATGEAQISTGIGFFDHMLTLFAHQAAFDLTITAAGDLHVDAHHTVEDVGIVLGDALRQGLGDKVGIARYGHAYVPMDEALVRAVVDLSGRAYCVYAVPVVSPRLGDFDTELAEDFFGAFAANARMNLHVDLIRGRNSHHVIEAAFKAVARALRLAVAVVPGQQWIPSTKGTLE